MTCREDSASWSFERVERRPRSAPRPRKAGARAKNPFIEYDFREKRLNQERKWLQEDSSFLEQRREELRFGALLNQLNIQNDPDDHLYENRTFYGPHSMAMKASKARRNQRGQLRASSAPIIERPPKEAVCPSCLWEQKGAAALKSLAQVLKISSEDIQRRPSFRESFQSCVPTCLSERLQRRAEDFAKSLVTFGKHSVKFCRRTGYTGDTPEDSEAPRDRRKRSGFAIRMLRFCLFKEGVSRFGS
ncbi:unnamed protein product [Symbiodinium pilosum]|uniref:Uncharacterized protein n=1 Tax=Symbiodinium pilosum TaxID=2952 RepID=A0A812R0Z4_SYMPI|nr:unnamed protein product [Symbiodinium pilosum]